MIEQQTVNDLIQLEKLFTNPHNWGRATWRRKNIGTTDGFCYCLGGGMAKVIGETEYRSEYMMLEPRVQKMRKALGFENTGEMVNWNDAMTTTYLSLMTRISRTIREAQLILNPKMPTKGRKFGSKDKQPRKKK
jgi:hypothetical protein